MIRVSFLNLGPAAECAAHERVFPLWLRVPFPDEPIRLGGLWWPRAMRETDEPTV